MLIRYIFRGYFGLLFSNKWGFFVDRLMCKKIRDFMEWVDYPTGNRRLKRWTVRPAAMAISSDGRYLFNASKLGSIEVHDLTNLKRIQKWEAHTPLKQDFEYLHTLSSLVYCRGWLVSAGGEDFTIKLWDSHTYRLINTLKGHTDDVTSVDVSHTQDLIVSGSEDTSVRVWSLKKGECLRVLNGHLLRVQCVRVMNGDGIISLSQQDVSMRKWNWHNGKEERKVDSAGMIGASMITVNCDASLIACITPDILLIFRWPDLIEVRQFYDQGASDAVFHPWHPKILAMDEADPIMDDDSSDLSDEKSSLRLFDVESGKCIYKIQDAHQDGIEGLCFTPDGSRLISVGSLQMTKLWDLTDLTLPAY